MSNTSDENKQGDETISVGAGYNVFAQGEDRGYPTGPGDDWEAQGLKKRIKAILDAGHQKNRGGRSIGD